MRFNVTIIPQSEHVINGDTLTLTVGARYFFGQPVAGAQVEVTPYIVRYDDWYQHSN